MESEIIQSFSINIKAKGQCPEELRIIGFITVNISRTRYQNKDANALLFSVKKKKSVEANLAYQKTVEPAESKLKKFQPLLLHVSRNRL